MLLAVDIGNSNISLGIFNAEALLMRAKVSVQTRRSADEYAAVLYSLLRMHGIEPEDIGGCILSSVVPGLTGLVEEAVRSVTGAAAVRVGPGIRTGFRIRIDDPSQLGGDLAADALAALTEYGAPVVIIDAGTVTTIAAVDKERTYLGGCILPGLRAGAGRRQGTPPRRPAHARTRRAGGCRGPPRAGAMRSGLLLGSAMMVDGFLDRYTALPGMAGAKCVATGGSADLATAHCRREIIRDPDLTLKGLRYLYEANRPKRRHP